MARADRPTRAARREARIAAASETQRQRLAGWRTEHPDAPELGGEGLDGGSGPATELVRLVSGCDAAGVPLERTALATAVRVLAERLASDHPGQSLEVRVPPYAAIQCDPSGTGPTHTRGTPPNVVETDPLTFLRLATGRLDWHRARADGLVSASGIRADLSGLVPIRPDAD